jgi:hypothetical protein
LPATITSVQVVELGLGDGVIDVHRREQQFAALHHLVQAMHAGGGFLGDTLDAVGDLGPLVLGLFQAAAQQVEEDFPFLVRVRLGGRNGAGLLEFAALVHQHGGIAAVVEDHVGAFAIGPRQGLLRAPPVFLEGLALPGVDGDAARGNGGSGVVLGGKDVA